jgi:hypothetical protein
MINDFATLSEAVANWLARSDLATVIPDLIQLAEVRIMFGGTIGAEYIPGLRVRQMHTVVSGNAADGVISLPADFLEVQQLLVPYGCNSPELTPVKLEGPNTIRTGVPKGYAVIGNELHIVGGPGDAAYTLTYYARIPPLSHGQNWLILENPALYLHATLLEAAPYLKADRRIEVWVAQFKADMDGMRAADQRSRFGPGVRMRMRYAP